MMMTENQDYIEISDDEDIQLLGEYINVEPIVIDLTEEEQTSPLREKSQQSTPKQQQSPPRQYKTQDFLTGQFHQHQFEHQKQFNSHNFNSQPLSSQQFGSQQFQTHQFHEQEHEREHEQHQSSSSQHTPSQQIPSQQPQYPQQIPQQSESQQQQQESPKSEFHNPHHLQQPQQPPTPPPPQSVPAPAPAPAPTISDEELLRIQKELGNQKYRNNLFDEAIRTYKRANDLAKKLGDMEMSAIIHFNLAMAYYRLGSLDQAADECANAVRINDNYLKAHIKRGEIYIRQRKFEEAVICYEHLCELDKTNRDYETLLNNAREYAKRTVKRDHFDILGLPKNFTREDLKKTYRQIALDHHPDRHSGADVVTRRIHEKKFKDATEANSFLQLRFGYNR